jgi:hypothetical protein
LPLTDAQFASLTGKRKGQPPTYYRADTDEEVSVAGDIEDALILASSEAKAKAIAYVRTILDANNGTSDYADLLREYTLQQAANAQAQKAASDSLLQQFSSFKDGLTQGADEETLREGMTPLMKALNRGIGRVGNQNRAFDFGNDYATSAGDFFNTKLTDAQKRELRSWIRVIATYQ